MQSIKAGQTVEIFQPATNSRHVVKVIRATKHYYTVEFPGFSPLRFRQKDRYQVGTVLGLYGVVHELNWTTCRIF